MNLYKIGGIIAVLVCLGILVFSYLSWQDKLQQAGVETEVSSDSEDEIKATEDEKEDNDDENKDNDETKSDSQTTQTTPSSDDFVNIDNLITNMDEQVQNLFLQKNSEGEPLQFLIVGSQALESGNPGYAELLNDALKEAYGDSIQINTEAVTGTSDNLQSVDLEAGYDLALLEPMTLMNNDRLSIEQEREDVRDFNSRLQEANSDALVVLHPPQPIYGAGYYRAQVQALGEFANLYGFPYINHWNAWPDTDDLSLKEHLTEEAVPNTKGAEVWASELIDYFIAN